MQECKGIWLAGLLTTIVWLSGSATAWSQEVQAAYAPPADWESWKAEVDAKLEKISDNAAKAKKKKAGKPSVTFGGRLYADWYLYNQDAGSMTQIGDQQDGFRFDTVRIFAKGTAFHVVDYKIQFDFAGTQQGGSTGANTPPPDAHTHTLPTLQAATFKDVYIAIKELPLVGHIKAGHFKEPYSLDELTSSRFITFMERSLANAFSPGRNVGVMAYDTAADENVTWAIGAFISEVGDEPPIYRNDNGGTALTMRYTWTPWYDEATDRGLLHLGVCYSYRDIADGTVRYRSRPEADLGSYIVDTGSIGNTQDVQLLDFELAYVYGPFRIQSEYSRAFVRRAGAANPTFDGTYVQVSYFLTGEQRKYKRSGGSFSDRVKPFENFFRVRDINGCVQTGKGAWEVAYRASYIDLNGIGVSGGNATDHTIGLNWYLNPYTRWMFNYVNSDLRRNLNGASTGNMSIFETRIQIDF